MEEKKESWIEKEKNKSDLIQEMNELSDFTNLSEEEKHKRKIRMIEIAKILLSEHFSYSRKDKWINVENAEKK